MYRAARLIAAMFIAQSILLPASISTTTSGQIADQGVVLASCADTGQTSSTCRVRLDSQSIFQPSGGADVAISGDWNIVQTEFGTGAYSPNGVGGVTASTRATWTVDDTVTVHGGTGPAFLLVQFVGERFDYGYGQSYSLLVNGGPRPLDNGIIPVGFVVPFVFDQPFPLTLGLVATGMSLGDWTVGSGSAALLPPQVFRTYGGGPPSDPITEFTVVRESGASFGVPEPGTLTMFAAALALAGLAKLTRRTH
jgi:hypothetical protein